MRRAIQVAFGILLLGTITVPAAAQSSFRGATVVSAPAGTRVVRITDPAAIRNADIANAVSIPVPSANTVSTLINGGYPVPGLGFDFTHHAAVNRNLGVRAVIDPATQHQLALARDLRRDLGRGAVPVALPAIINTNVNQVFVTVPPPVVILQQPAVVEVPVERPQPARHVENSPPAPPQPVAELGEIVLIRRDGSLVFAVGFSVVDGRLVYVTREGIRRSLPLADLDVESTRLMNEERGTSLRL
jgi:hypothetical protein